MPILIFFVVKFYKKTAKFEIVNSYISIEGICVCVVPCHPAYMLQG